MIIPVLQASRLAVQASRRAVLVCLLVSLPLLALVTPPRGYGFVYFTWLFDTMRNKASAPLPADTGHFRVVPGRRLIFCLIDKNANTAFADVLCSISREARSSWRRWIETHWRTWADFELGCRWTSTSLLAQGMNSTELWSAFWHRRPGWTSAVFVRDPLERFLSAYLSKCTRGRDPDFEVCQQVFGHKYVSFAHAVQVLTAVDDLPPGWANDHFRLQSRFCNGTVGQAAAFDHTYVLDRATSRAAVEDLLERVGVARSDLATVAPAVDYHFPQRPPPGGTPSWAGEGAAGAAGRGGAADANGAEEGGGAEEGEAPLQPKRQHRPHPPGGSFVHATHADARLASYFSDPAHVRALLSHYAPDYRALPELGGVPSWAARIVGEDFVRSLSLQPSAMGAGRDSYRIVRIEPDDDDG